MAHVAELPGCFAVGRDAPRAVGRPLPRLPSSSPGSESIVNRWYLRLTCRARAWPTFFVAEIKRGGAPSAAGSKAALFEFDKADWSDDMLERTLRWLSYSRADLLARIEGMSEADLESRQIGTGRTLGRSYCM